MINFLGKNKLQQFFIKPEASLLHGMKILDASAKGILLIVSPNKKLLGVATDGDIRRALLNHIPMDGHLSKIMCTSPIVGKKGIHNADALAILNKNKIVQLPIVDCNNIVIDLAIYTDIIRTQKKPKTAVIMAGGKGSRLYPLTLNTPKPLLQVGGKPVLDWILIGLRMHGVETCYLSLREHKDQIQKYYGDGNSIGLNIKYIIEDEVKGTAGALSLINPLPDHPIIVMNGDILTALDYTNFYQFHIEHNVDLSVAVKRQEIQIPYGVMETRGTIITEIKEKPSHFYQINTGIYILSPEVIKLIPKSGSYSMVDLINTLLSSNMIVKAFSLREYWLDIGQHKDYEKAQTEAKVHLNQKS